MFPGKKKARVCTGAKGSTRPGLIPVFMSHEVTKSMTFSPLNDVPMTQPCVETRTSQPQDQHTFNYQAHHVSYRCFLE